MQDGIRGFFQRKYGYHFGNTKVWDGLNVQASESKATLEDL